MPKDLFSTQATTYSRYRPGYPPELIEFILSFTNGRTRAWDCATGNGQAATLLAPHFEEVMATDWSTQQIAQAVACPAIRYSVSAAESTAFPDDYFDLITIAQAYHWLPFAAFHREATRVGRQGAIVAAWGYNLVQSANPQFNRLIREFYESLREYWDPERRYVEESYRTVSFAFDPLPAREFISEVHWAIDDLLGFFRSWSSVQNYRNSRGDDPVDPYIEKWQSIWNEEAIHEFFFPIFLRIGKVTK
jgi:hypothetical protein